MRMDGCETRRLGWMQLKVAETISTLNNRMSMSTIATRQYSMPRTSESRMSVSSSYSRKTTLTYLFGMLELSPYISDLILYIGRSQAHRRGRQRRGRRGRVFNGMRRPRNE
ncbi:hypothetical protein D9757_014393 [Collybiopsis confluens]|uniref:Uncharacterized protein n=1 Tax=Collybiopsis confluens TaxID=2823264 RepID=A0A8H5FTB9_9AGAR|nr:hypothetical protein D9757_014393 [Collybiopsis confluens]